MLVTLDDYLEGLGPAQSANLISPSAFADIRAIARQLPPVSVCAFECPLTTDSASSDFAVVALRSEMLVRRMLDPTDKTFRSEEPSWRALRSFLRVWTDTESLAHRMIHNAWLEFDVEHGANDGISPSLFYFGLLATHDLQHAAQSALDILAGPRPSAAVQCMSRCFEALPADAHVFQVGVAIGRHTHAVRLCVKGLSADDTPSYLGRIGYHGNVDELQRLVVALAGLTAYHTLHIDTTTEVLSTVGIECYPEKAVSPQVGPEWLLFLEYLVANGLCRAQKREGLLAWPGSVECGLFWPEALLRALSHVKVIYRPYRSLEAKAYLMLGHWARSDILDAKHALAY